VDLGLILWTCGVLLDGLTATCRPQLCMVLGNIPEITGSDERRSENREWILERFQTRKSLLDAE